MPITAKFSKTFYDKLGHEIADEMVDWFNRADLTYRTQLRELNDLNYARFEAKVDQRFAEQDTKWERRFAELDAKWERRFAELDAKWERRFGALEHGVERYRGDLLKWMFVFWSSTVLTMLGLSVAVVRLLGT